MILETEGIRVLNVHHEHHRAPVFEFDLGPSRFIYDQYYDHVVLNGKFTNASLLDLTNYPQTYIPATYGSASHPAANLNTLDSLPKYEVLGVHLLNNESRSNQIKFDMQMFEPGCALAKEDQETVLDVSIDKVKILYM